MAFQDVQNPGIGGLKELTDAEALLVQSITALGSPAADRILFYDFSAGGYAFLTAGSGLTITGTTMTASASGVAGTINEIAYFDSATSIASLTVATYPSLTELSYVKGLSSAIQTQLGLKAPLASPTFTGTVTIPITPSNTTDAASKGYVDAVAQGLSVKQSVLLATAVALPTNTYLAGVITITATGTLTVDGTVTALNDRILVKNEATALKNGIYKVTTAGDVGVAAVLTRSTDMDISAEFPGAFVFVETGTVNAAAGFVCTNSTNPNVGTDSINFTQFSGAGEITASTGLQKSGNTLSIDTATTVDKTTAQALTNKDLTGAGNTFPTFNQNTTGTATNATNVGITDDTTTNATMYPLWVTANTGNLPVKVSSTKLSFNPSTGIMTLAGDASIHGLTVGLGTNSISTNTALGVGALAGANSGAGQNVAVGNQALHANTSGVNNIGLGDLALAANLGGSANLGIGTAALQSNTSGSSNVGIGIVALSSNVSGNYNVGIGQNSLNAVLGSNNVGIGYFAGAYETGSNAFYINNIDQATTAGDKANSLMYGVFNATPASQTLRVNAYLGILVNPTALVTLGAGTATASTAPLKFTAGTNLTTAEAGAMEFDGKVFYTTPVGSARGVSPSVMYSIVSSSNFTLSTSTGVQTAFESTGDVWTLAAATTYEFEGIYYITKSGTTCTIAMAFALAGGASVTSIQYWTNANNTAGGGLGGIVATTVSSTVATTTTTGNQAIFFKGLIRMNAGGTVTPQIDFSASPTSPVMNANSYIKFTPMGTNTQNTVGSVA